MCVWVCGCDPGSLARHLRDVRVRACGCGFPAVTWVSGCTGFTFGHAPAPQAAAPVPERL
eukprot:1187223-Prorocentrum_minimum.AAC.1